LHYIILLLIKITVLVNNKHNDNIFTDIKLYRTSKTCIVLIQLKPV